MLTFNVLQAETAKWEGKLGVMGLAPLSDFRGKPKATRLAQQCALALKSFDKRNERLSVLQKMFNLKNKPASTYSLTVAQAYALRNLAYLNNEISPEFETFLSQLQEIL